MKLLSLLLLSCVAVVLSSSTEDRKGRLPPELQAIKEQESKEVPIGRSKRETYYSDPCAIKDHFYTVWSFFDGDKGYYIGQHYVEEYDEWVVPMVRYQTCNEQKNYNGRFSCEIFDLTQTVWVYDWYDESPGEELILKQYVEPNGACRLVYNS